MADERVEKHLRGSRILYGSMFVSIGIFVAVANMAVQTRDPQTPIPQPELAHEPFSQPLVLALIAVAVMIIAITPFLRQRLLPPRTYGHGGGDVRRALSRLVGAQVLSWGLTEVVGVFGLILTMLSYEPRFVFGFCAVAALVMLAYAPSRKMHEDVARVASA
ncbi:MAG TPA: hypothetical protein VIV11_30325 [Kofleriaceae bacterium]